MNPFSDEDLARLPEVPAPLDLLEKTLRRLEEEALILPEIPANRVAAAPSPPEGLHARTG